MGESKFFTEERPWGGFTVFAKNEEVTVKILFIKKGEKFSLQKHFHRNEFWKVLSGTPNITLGERVIQAKSNDEFEIPPDTAHRAEALIDDTMILEISRGKFDENDIVRLEDKYGRT